MLHIRLHNSNVQHILHVTQFGDCVNLCLSVKGGGGRGSVDIWQREGGGGVNKKKSGSPDFRSPEVGISVREPWHICENVHTQT